MATSLRVRLAIALAVGSVAGCAPESHTAANRFGSTGQLIALSGAGAGARHACITCHGLQGEGNGAGVPRLAAVEPGYLDRQLQAYADGRRSHPEMSWIAKQLTGPQRIAVAHYYARLPYPAPEPGTEIAAPQLYSSGDPARGIPACASCHGMDGMGLGPAYPPLAGQPAAYLAQQFDAWRHSKRRNDPGGVMLKISRRLTEREGAALAAYAAQLPGPTARPGSAAASR